MTNGAKAFFPAIGSKFNSCHDNLGQFCSGGGGSNESFSTPRGGEIKIGDEILWQTPIMRNRGGQTRSGNVLGMPNKDGYFDVTDGIGGPKKEISISDVIKMTHRKQQ